MSGKALDFFPVTRDDLDALRWDYVDVVLVTGDAYVDHPSFGTAVIARVLERDGLRVAVLAMPRWREPAVIATFGRPRLFFGVSSGNVDSMIARHTAFKKVRNDDPYTPAGIESGKPERAVIVYCNMIRAVYKDVPIVIGGIEASMRRFAHYDFWSDRVRRSIILDARAHLLVYGMGEGQVREAAKRIREGNSLSGIPGTVEVAREAPPGALLLPPEEDACARPDAYLEFYRSYSRNQHRVLAMPSGKRFIVQYPQAETTREALDAVYALPFTRKPHPSYAGKIPAFEMIKHSITAHRGCVSGCAFCSLSLHQGRRIVRRSVESVLAEARLIAAMDYFTGHISDVGGPSANMYGTGCAADWKCARESCAWPDLCPNLRPNSKEWMKLLASVEKVPGVKQVTVGSGIRYDLLMRDDPSCLRALLARHVSGQLKIAPEHTSARVLRAMRKAPLVDLEDFMREFFNAAKAAGKKLYVVPYLMSCHPGCTDADMSTMKNEVQKIFHFIPEQVQAFIPLPLTLSSVMYYTGKDPFTGETLFSEKDPRRRRRQHDILFK
ncbi:MAG: YgiQ family radical SAM protein [Spirochaetes bacterium]|nr:MAG: YgiQ family radical SAM protein [Spirochaetota bacterium]